MTQSAELAQWMREAAEEIASKVADDIVAAMRAAGFKVTDEKRDPDGVKWLLAILARHRDAEVERLKSELWVANANYQNMTARRDLLRAELATRPDASELVEALEKYADGPWAEAHGESFTTKDGRMRKRLTIFEDQGGEIARAALAKWEAGHGK